MTDPDVLVIRMRWMFGWQQHRPGGCRCMCRLFHSAADASVCLAAAEPGRLIRVETDSETSGPLPVCLPCYTALAPLAE